jgi:hypothetical protein
VLGFDIIEVRFAAKVPLVRFDQISQSNFWKNESLSNDAAKNIEKTPFRCREQVLPFEERSEGNDIHGPPRGEAHVPGKLTILRTDPLGFPSNRLSGLCQK